MFYPKSYIFPQKYAISTYLMVKHGSSWALLTASHMWITQLSILGQVNVDCCWFHICFHISKMCFRASDFKWIYWTMFGPTVNLFFSKLIIVHYRCSPRTLITRTVLGRSVVFLSRTDGLFCCRRPLLLFNWYCLWCSSLFAWALLNWIRKKQNSQQPRLAALSSNSFSLGDGLSSLYSKVLSGVMRPSGQYFQSTRDWNVNLYIQVL